MAWINGIRFYKRRCALPHLASRGCGRLFKESLQGSDIPAIVSRSVHRRLRDEGNMLKSRVIQQAAEWLRPDSSLANMLVAVKLRSSPGLGVVAVENGHTLETYG